MSFHGAKNLPSLKRKSQLSAENEPKVDDRAKLLANQKNAIERFNSKKAFHEPKYKKLSFMNRYPRTFMSGFTFISLSLFFRLDTSEISVLKIFLSLANHYTTPSCESRARRSWNGPSSSRPGWRLAAGGTIRLRSTCRAGRLLNMIDVIGNVDKLGKILLTWAASEKNMESVRKAKTRLSSYPAHLAACTSQAAGYGRCVGEHLGEVKKDQCRKEFEVFMTCVRNNAKRIGTKL